MPSRRMRSSWTQGVRAGTADHPTRTVCDNLHYDPAFVITSWHPKLRKLGLLSSRDLMMTLLKTQVNSITDFAAAGKSLNPQHAHLAELLPRFRFPPSPNTK